MADFLPAYERMIVNEGGYVNHSVAGDRGGQTFAGIARNAHPKWQGWAFLDRGTEPPTAMVRTFYVENFWNPINGDSIRDQRVAGSIFDFAVNAGAKTAAKLAQIVVGVTPDGQVGPVTVDALNNYDAELFLARFSLAKLARYRDICKRDPVQKKFLLGWVNRVLREAA